MKELLKGGLPTDANRTLNFNVGDTVKVHYKIQESGKERIQVYEGVVISISNGGNGKSFTVRRISYDVGVERVFPLYSPRIAKIELIRKGRVRRSKLFFLRERSGKSARIRELKGGKTLVAEDKKRQAAADAAATTSGAPASE
ncbi:ribosomal protein L19 [Leptospira inadai serovar Lyme str. 10]|uniref:Large ribosomal subunit protein bL19 n=2 Tax=Leptospira inadai serovar Lyme TaxID=293084 RepID=V6HC14_9LEPT|nr:50S ribosomal protein L19 [Leptospira inadai]EQA37316.1 ribosomal protein L19 [Leptospira inadai serovar Lyme str. 10]PNV76301.1 50S ribosomal protein L19 [Leptospira inadai serovar Lyme]